MKKLIYILAFTLVTGLSLFSCTEEEIKPAKDGDSSGGGAIVDPW